MRSKVFQEILNETPAEVENFVRLYGELVLRVNTIIDSKKDLPKTPEIQNWLSGHFDFSLRSIAKLEIELGMPLLNVVC